VSNLSQNPCTHHLSLATVLGIVSSEKLLHFGIKQSLKSSTYIHYVGLVSIAECLMFCDRRHGKSRRPDEGQIAAAAAQTMARAFLCEGTTGRSSMRCAHPPSVLQYVLPCSSALQQCHRMCSTGRSIDDSLFRLFWLVQMNTCQVDLVYGTCWTEPRTHGLPRAVRHCSVHSQCITALPTLLPFYITATATWIHWYRKHLISGRAH
jgi:hypothetical protein